MDDKSTVDLMSAVQMSIRLLVHALENTTAFDRHAYGEILEKAALASTLKGGPPPVESLESMFLRSIAQSMQGDLSEHQHGWNPAVIEGGLKDE